MIQLPNTTNYFEADFFQEWIADYKSCVQNGQRMPKTVIFTNDTVLLNEVCMRVCTAIGQEAPVSPDAHVRLFMGTFGEDKAKLAAAFTPADSPIWLLFATSAFGMGLDIPDISFVVAMGSPVSLHETYQYLGRAGRNGRQAFFFGLWTTKQKEMTVLKSCQRDFLGRGDSGFACYWQRIWSLFSPQHPGGTRVAFACCSYCDVQSLRETHRLRVANSGNSEKKSPTRSPIRQREPTTPNKGKHRRKNNQADVTSSPRKQHRR